MKVKTVLHYWRAHGRAETARMLLWLGGIPYENHFQKRARSLGGSQE